MSDLHQPPLNLYGDKIVQTTGSHGADIASQRIDELDLETLRFAISSEIPEKVAVDLGCGLGFQGIRLAMLGWRCVMYDILDIHERINIVNQLLGLHKLVYKKIDLRHARAHDFPPMIGLAYSQRFIHYLRFDEASALLAAVASRLSATGCLYLSASGLESEFGIG